MKVDSQDMGFLQVMYIVNVFSFQFICVLRGKHKGAVDVYPAVRYWFVVLSGSWAQMHRLHCFYFVWQFIFKGCLTQLLFQMLIRHARKLQLYVVVTLLFNFIALYVCPFTLNIIFASIQTGFCPVCHMLHVYFCKWILGECMYVIL